jgi:hypothetical protein
MVGSVLVEGTVQQVLPALITNRDGIIEIIGKITASLKEKESK